MTSYRLQATQEPGSPEINWVAEATCTSVEPETRMYDMMGGMPYS